MGNQRFQDPVWWATGDAGTPVANTTAETIIYPDQTIWANYMQDGRILHIWAMGKYSTTGTPTGLISFRWGGVGGTLLAKSAAVTLGSGVTNALWEARLMVTTRANGVSGGLYATGMFIAGSGTAPTVGSATGAPAISPITAGGITAPAQAATDLTANTAFSMTWTWGTASASNTTTGIQYNALSVN